MARRFIYGPGIDEPICLIDGADANGTYYYHFDGLGSVVALSDVNNVLVERYAYDVFGRPTIRDVNGTELSESAVANPYLFTGRRYDAEAGLYYYRARYYDFANGRFLQPDPTGYTDGLNMYAYVGNSPLNWSDPSGLCKSESALQQSALGRAMLGLSGFGVGFGEAVTGFLSGVKHAVLNPLTLSPIYQLAHARKTAGHIYDAIQQFRADITNPDAERNGQAIGRLTGTIFSAGAAAEITAGITEGLAAGASGGNPIQGLPRTGRALKTDAYHAFPDVVDNFASGATKTQLQSGASLYQIEGSLTGQVGRFEWIVDSGNVTHRMFVPGGTLNGVPIKP